MTYIYEVRINGKLTHSSDDREDCHDHINKKHGDIIQYFKYDTLGNGKLETWDNGINKISLIEKRKTKIDPRELLESYDKNENEEYVPKEINVQKLMPCTPKRTRIKQKNNKPLVKAQKGKIIESDDGTKWISKKTKNNTYKWEKYYEKTYSNKPTGRKAPSEPAKKFNEGVKRKGLDGNKWIVKIDKNGIKKWLKF
jgi:hypothetical protein